MSKLPLCQLTTRDFSILEALLERDVHHDGAFLRLLRQKLSIASVTFQDDVRPDVATINSCVEFTVDSDPIDSRTLVHGGGDAFPGPTLPITTIRGLALLGLTEGEALVVERSDGGNEEVRLDRICHQPEASRKHRLDRQAPIRATSEQKSSIVAFEVRRKPTPVSLERSPVEPDDDDPGPRAA